MRILLAGLLLVILVVAGVVLKLVGNEKTVLVPPEIKRSFWVSGNAVSREYLEDMAYWYAGLALMALGVFALVNRFEKSASPS